MRLMGLVCFTLWSAASAVASGGSPISLSPASLQLQGRWDRGQLLITQNGAERGDGRVDLTHLARYSSRDMHVATVDERGCVVAVADGATIIEARVGEELYQIPVQVTDSEQTQVGFFHDVQPILAKSGCAAGACHAAQHGQGGFKLSVFGFDPQADYEAIVKASRGRRVSFSNPELSLFLRKPSMGERHEGGLRVESGSVEYALLEHWIESGAPPRPNSPRVESIQIEPAVRVGEPRMKQQLRVVAHYADGRERDVTPLAIYDALDPGIASVDAGGLVSAQSQGQTNIMVRFEGQAAVSTVLIPFSERFELADWTSQNFVDELAAQKFRDLGLQPSPLCDDATFVRRAFLDCIGTLPSPTTVVEFIESQASDKRQRLIDRLLGLTGDPELDTFNDAYAAYWTLKWSDLIRNNSIALGEQGMWALHNWIKTAFRENWPYDRFVRALITAQGSIYTDGPANFYRVNSDPAELTEAASQLFLGVRLECAKCHHHPFEKYSQTDYYSLAAFFARVGSKNSEEFGLFGRETVVMVRDTGEVKHPRTNQQMLPTTLDGQVVEHELDRRIPLADWLTSPENPFLAKSVVNRYMRFLLGSGLVEPVDDMRTTNPPSNAPLLDALAADFVKHDFDLKHLIRTIMTSRLYGLSSQPTPENRADQRFYSHYLVKRLTAEPLLDAVDTATGVPTKFPNLPLGTRAIDLPDAEYTDYFLTTFAKPRRVSVCECERPLDASLAQALHTLNGDTIAKKIADKQGLLTQLLEAKKSHDETVTQLYLASLNRWPTETEMNESRAWLAEAQDQPEFYQDLLWALINSKQFLFVR
jgi:hypothetical protein